MQTATALASRPSVPTARAAPRRAALPWIDASLATAIACVALMVRWPYLWTIPRFTDETLEVLHSLAIVRDGARPLTNYDSYYGALYNYVVAAALWLGGESPFAPRIVVLIAGALTAVVTYALGRELAIHLLWDAGAPESIRRHAEGALVPRLTGALAALMLATNGQHVVVNSHIAWSNCLTPLFTALALWALLRATRRPGSADRDGLTGATTVPRDRRAGPALAAAGLALGAALQTHPLVATILPGAALGVLSRQISLLRTPWPYLAAVLFLVGYANVLAYNLESGFESIWSARRMSAAYARDQQETASYLLTAGAMGVMLLRTLGGAVDHRDAAAEYLADPLVVAVGGLAGTGLVWLARRGQPLPLLAVLGALLLLPAVNSKFQTMLTSRYLMPLVPLLFACAAAALIAATMRARTALERGGRGWPVAPLVALLGLGLVLGPLPPLARYYDRALAGTDTNERILRLMAEIESAREPGEVVLVDERIGSQLPDTGVTELRGLEHLLVFGRVPYRVIRPTSDRLRDEVGEVSTALAVLNARDAAAADRRLVVTPLDPRPPVTTGRMADYRLYRLSRGRA